MGVMRHDRELWTRRDLVARALPAVAAAGFLLTLPHRRLLADEDGLVETPSDDEGPFYRAGSPERSDLRDKESRAAPITVSGLVRAEDGKPLPGVLLDVWHADAGGAYDNRSPAFRHRGRFKTGADGRYKLETNYPGRYGLAGGTARPRHVHVKFSGAGLWDLTTQMYFDVRPNVDVAEELVVAMTWAGEGRKRTGTGVWPVVLARRA
jgi:protocatechuate 3,4-dioxygenase beta subunit